MCFSDIWSFNIITKEYVYIPTKGHIVEARTCHSAIMFKGQGMIVFGGINLNNKCLNDVVILDMEN